MDQAEQDRQTRVSYEAAKATRNDPIEREMQTLQMSYKAISELSDASMRRVMTYLNAVMGERLN